MGAPQPPRRRRPPPGFQPRFTLSILYLAGFFFLYALLIVLPEMLGVLESTPPGPEQQELAEAAAREALDGADLLLAFLAAAATVGVGAYYQVLPGLRVPR